MTGRSGSGRNGQPTARDVADLAGVSPSTVSLVLQNKGNIPDETRTRVQAAAKRMGYQRLRGRRAAISRGSPVGIIAEDLLNPYYAELYHAIDLALDEHDRLPLLVSSRGSVQRQNRLLRNLVEIGCVGAFLVPVNGSGQETLDAIRDIQIPVVLGVRHLGFGAFDYVGPNYFLGMQMATRHLLDLGHRRIAFVGGLPENTAYAERLGGFRITISGVEGGEIDALEMPGPPTTEFGVEAMKKLAALDEPPTAIIGYNDLLSFGLMSAAREAGLMPGRDIAIVGFDDIRAAAQRTVPLTTVSTPPSRIGEEMARLLEARISNPEADPVNIIPPPVLKVRASCGAPLGPRGMAPARQERMQAVGGK